MKIAIAVFDRVNLVSLAKILYALHDFEGSCKVDVCSFKSDIIDEYGLKIAPGIYGESLFGYDVLVVPDGVGALAARYDEIFLSWIRSASRTKLKIGLDLGSLVLGGAGFLDGKIACVRAGYKNALKEYCEFSDVLFSQSDDVITISEFNDNTKIKLSEILANC